jgi:DNA-binding MarR family transcriptional regulator/GNAT superfamily N-acetyltransferase
MTSQDVVARIREFNRGWTKMLGLLDQGLLQTDHSLTEGRALFELAQRDTWERSALRDRLGIDASFLTRVLRSLEEAGLVDSRTSTSDKRALDISLTDSGRSEYRVLDQRSADQIAALVEPMSADQQRLLIESMEIISKLARTGTGPGKVTLRGLAMGDLGWVVQRHGAIYADEYGWNSDMEGLVARIVADYQRDFTPGRENAWIAELDGARAGCIFCCEKDRETAQLRILLVEPWARGHGIGARLVDEVISFAKQAGYSRMVLWTNDVLTSARRIYEAAGFELVDEDKHHSFGHDLVGQNWELAL